MQYRRLGVAPKGTVAGLRYPAAVVLWIGL
jgi:hypothetical protein